MEDPTPKLENQGLIAASVRVVGWLKRLIVLLVVFESSLACLSIVASFDFPWQLAEGNFILDHGHPAKTVLQAFGEASSHFTNEYILYEILIAGINRMLGGIGLLIFFWMLCLLIYAPCLWALGWSRGGFSLTDICYLMLAQFIVNMRITARPELIADVCYVFTCMMLMRWPWRSWNLQRTFILGLIFFLWANAHGSFLLGLAVVAFWYGQFFFFEWRTLLFARDFTWIRPGLAVLIGCCVNPYGPYRLAQPFQLHSLLWGQGTSLEMWPVTSGTALLPLIWTAAAVMPIALQMRERKCYWMTAMLILLLFLAFCSIRYSIFVGVTLLVVTWDGMTHPRKLAGPPALALSFFLIRLGLYTYLTLAFIYINYSVIHDKTVMFQNFSRYGRPKTQVPLASSIIWLEEHPVHAYFFLSDVSEGSCAQMPGVEGIHPLIDSGTHRYSDPTNQLHYYLLFSPGTLKLTLSKLNINAVAVNSFNISWASVLNANAGWCLKQINSDSQLYLPRGRESMDEDRILFSRWEDEEQRHPDDPDAPPGFSTERIMRGLKLRPDRDSLQMLLKASDARWTSDPQIVFMEDWLDEVPDDLVTESLRSMGGKMDNSSAALRILFLFRLRDYEQAAEIAQRWQPELLNRGYQDLQMLRVEAFIRKGDVEAGRKILGSFRPQPRYSFRWARLCEQVYGHDSPEMPVNARLLMDLGAQQEWQNDLIASLNQNILRISEQSSAAPR